MTAYVSYLHFIYPLFQAFQIWSEKLKIPEYQRWCSLFDDDEWFKVHQEIHAEDIVERGEVGSSSSDQAASKAESPRGGFRPTPRDAAQRANPFYP
jgi:hypothetical protein